MNGTKARPGFDEGQAPSPEQHAAMGTSPDRACFCGFERSIEDVATYGGTLCANHRRDVGDGEGAARRTPAEHAKMVQLARAIEVVRGALEWVKADAAREGLKAAGVGTGWQPGKDGKPGKYTWEGAQAAAAHWFDDYEADDQRWRRRTEIALATLDSVLANLSADAPQPGARTRQQQRRYVPPSPVRKGRRQRAGTMDADGGRWLNAAVDLAMSYFGVTRAVALAGVHAARECWQGTWGHTGTFGPGATRAAARQWCAPLGRREWEERPDRDQWETRTHDDDWNGEEAYGDDYRRPETDMRKVSQVLTAIEGWVDKTRDE